MVGLASESFGGDSSYTPTSADMDAPGNHTSPAENHACFSNNVLPPMMGSTEVRDASSD